MASLEPIEMRSVGIKMGWIDKNGKAQASFKYLQVKGKFSDLDELIVLVAKDFKELYEYTQELIRDGKVPEHEEGHKYD